MSAIERAFRLGAALALLIALPARGQALVTDADLARVRRDTPSVSEADLAAAARRHASPVLPSSAPAAPRVDALPRPAAGPALDLDALARGYQAEAAGGARPEIGVRPRLLVFVSFSLPAETLRRLLAQAARAQATVLFRGLSGDSLPATVARLQSLNGPAGAAVQIDPRAFERYAIRQVPSFVLTADAPPESACPGKACPPPADFVQAAGDVSLDYALERMQGAQSGLAPAAGVFLARLRG